MPSSSTRQLSTSAFSVNRSISRSASNSAAVLIEPPPALDPELAAGDALAHPGMHEEALAVGVLKVVGDAERRVESDQVGEVERADRGDLRVGQRPIDRGRVDAALALIAPH